MIGVTICDFALWPADEVPMLSRWRMQEQHAGTAGLGQLQLVFLELPKYQAGDQPRSVIDRWAYFFREAPNLTMVPEVLAQPPLRDALEAARAAGFSEDEWEAYIRADMALQDERGALALAHAEGRRITLIEAIEALCEALDIELSAERQQALARADVPRLEQVLAALRTVRANAWAWGERDGRASRPGSAGGARPCEADPRPGRSPGRTAPARPARARPQGGGSSGPARGRGSGSCSRRRRCRRCS